MIQDNIWLIGTGLMAKEYAKVLLDLKCNFVVVGRSKENCDSFRDSFNVNVLDGGLLRFLHNKPKLPNAVIVAVGIESLSETVLNLLDFGVKYILLEKPGFGYPSELQNIVNHKNSFNAKIVLAYNRRFYSSVMHAEKLIELDGGVTTFSFEFTEWSHLIKDLKKHPAEHQNWFLGNSSHIIDTAFFLSGKPKKICCFYDGGLPWHTKSSRYSGAGITDKKALFSYIANWEAPGRWAMEFSTKSRRYIFKPLETLQVQEIGSISINIIDIDDSLDKKYKPGLFLQTSAFLKTDLNRFCTIEEQSEMIQVYCKMSGYSDK